MLDDPLIFSLSLAHILLSNLLSWPLVRYLGSRPALSRSILTHLNTSLVLAINLNTSLPGLGLLLRAGLGPMPGPAATAFIFVLGMDE